MNTLLKNAQVQDYKGFERRNFYFNGHLATVIIPKIPEGDKKWIWRAEFLGAFDTVDVAMLEKGFYLVYYSLSNLYGYPQSVELMKGFYDFLVAELGFDSKTIIFGFSRGGLYTVNFAAKYPHTIYALYLDAPVLDIKSWPGGMGAGVGSPNEFIDCLKLYGLDTETVKDFKNNPIDKIGLLLEQKIPVLVIAGDSDEVVPHHENCQRLVDFYEKNAGKILYILKKGCGHHPHSVEDPTEAVDFLLSCL